MAKGHECRFIFLSAQARSNYFPATITTSFLYNLFPNKSVLEGLEVMGMFYA